MIGVEAIHRSMARLATEQGRTIEDVAEMIAAKTSADVARWVEEIRTGENEIRFIPQGATYFKQERWNDGNEEISERQIREARIGDEIARARAREDVG